MVQPTVHLCTVKIRACRRDDGGGGGGDDDDNDDENNCLC